MSSHIVSITLFIISFYLVLNTDLQINGYQEITIPERVFSFTYQYKKPNISDSENIYFYFRMVDQRKDYYYYRITIKTEDGKEEEIKVSSMNYFAYYVSELDDTNFFFEIRFAESYTLLFIDSSQEININLDKFINLNFITDYIYDIPPKALIFNVDTRDATQDQNKTIYFISKTGTFLNSDYLVSYCIEDEMNGNECNYIQLKKLLIKKDTKYKIRLSAYKINENMQFKYFEVIKEGEFGIIKYERINYDDRYYLVNVKDFVTFYIYYDYDFEYIFIKESEKKNLPDNINSFTFEDSSYSPGVETMEVKSNCDYLLIKIHSSNILYMFEKFISLQSDSYFIIEEKKFNYCIIRKKYGYNEFFI